MKEQTKITINLSKELLDKVKRIADADEMSVSALIRLLLIKYVESKT